MFPIATFLFIFKILSTIIQKYLATWETYLGTEFGFILFKYFS